MIDDRGGVIGAAFGPVRFPWTCSGAGELWAAIIALRYKGPRNIVIVTEYLELKKAWDRGDESGAHVRNHLGELWREFWRLVHDVGREGIDVIWIPSHRSDSQRIRDAIPLAMWLGNQAADAFAKQGASMHPKNGYAEALRHARECSAIFTLRMALRILRRCARCDFADADPVPYDGPSRARPQLDTRGHVIIKRGMKYYCDRCGRNRHTRRGLLAQPCQGPPLGVRAAHSTHKLWRNGPLFFCAQCAARCETRAHMIAKPCIGLPVPGTGRYYKRRYLLQGKGPNGERLPNSGRPTPVRRC